MSFEFALGVSLVVAAVGYAIISLAARLRSANARNTLLSGMAISLERERNEARDTANRLAKAATRETAYQQVASSQASQMAAEKNAWERVAVAFARFELHLEERIATNEPTPEDKATYRKAASLFADYSKEIIGDERWAAVLEKRNAPTH